MSDIFRCRDIISDGVHDPSRALLLMIYVCAKSKKTGESPRQVWDQVKAGVVGVKHG